MRLKVKWRNMLGISLLELMLSLAIIAILLIMATRYYQSANENNKRNQAVEMFAAVNGAVQTWRVDQIGSMAASATGGEEETTTSSLPSISDLVSQGYLPPSYGDGTKVAPWGGDIEIKEESSSAGKYDIGMTEIPSCEAVCNRVSSTIATDTGTSAATCSTNTCTATYSF